MQHCNDCGAWVWTPRPLCNECGSEHIEWTPMSGKGEIYSFTVIRQVVGRAASQSFQPDIPYVIAWVDLDEGPRMITNIVNCPVESKARHESVSRVRASLKGCLAAEVQTALNFAAEIHLIFGSPHLLKNIGASKPGAKTRR